MLWVIDAGTVSVREGSFVPLGYAFSMILGTAEAIGTWLVAMAHALWDVITFWS